MKTVEYKDVLPERYLNSGDWNEDDKSVFTDVVRGYELILEEFQEVHDRTDELFAEDDKKFVSLIQEAPTHYMGVYNSIRSSIDNICFIYKRHTLWLANDEAKSKIQIKMDRLPGLANKILGELVRQKFVSVDMKNLKHIGVNEVRLRSF